MCVLVSLCIRAGADVKFTDVTDVSGIEFRHFTGATGERYMPETMGAGCAFLDYNTDGHLDILLANGTSLIPTGPGEKEGWARPERYFAASFFTPKMLLSAPTAS